MIHEKLVCHALRLSYDFDHRVGRLSVESSGPNMTPCVEMFLAIDPNVEQIVIFEKDVPDMTYKRDVRLGKWEAFIYRREAE